MTVAWGVVPARGGSKSILRKNMVPVCGRPLIDYVCGAAKRSVLDWVIGSTDDPVIADAFQAQGIEVDWRPAELSADDSPVVHTVRRLLQLDWKERSFPDIIVLLQPTSPFTLPRHIDSIINTLDGDSAAASAQTIYPCPHIFHAWNQRTFVNGKVNFVFQKERMAAYNKQKKPSHWVFGNLFAVKSKVLLEGGDFFSSPSLGVEIEPAYGFDLDIEADISFAEAMIQSGIVHLKHMT